MSLLNNSFVYLGEKSDQHYKNIRIYADLGLHQDIADRVVKVARPGAKILDFGCGEGALSERLKDLGFDLVSVDMEEEKFQASTSFFQLNFNDSEAVASFIESRQGQFDVVLGIEVIEHVENQWDYVRDLKKLLKPEGHIVVTTPHTTSWLSRLTFLTTGRFHQFFDGDLSYGHISPLSPWELQLILSRCDFEDVQMTTGGTLPPLYFANLKFSLATCLGILLRPFMFRGSKNGWCLIATAKKKA